MMRPPLSPRHRAVAATHGSSRPVRLARLLTMVAVLSTMTACTHLVPDATPPSVTTRDDARVFRTTPDGIDVPQNSSAAVTPAPTGLAPSYLATADALPWWHRLGQPGLGATVDAALAQNPGLAATEKQLTAARHVLQASVSNAILPSIDVGASAARIRGPGIPAVSTSPDGNVQLRNAGATLYDNWSTFVRASYDVDLFGATRLDNDTRRKQVDAEAARLDAARLALASRVAVTTITVSALQAQWVDAERAAALSDADLDTLQHRAALGAVDDDQVLSARAQAASAHAAVAALDTQRATARHALAALLGRTPDAAPPAAPFDPLRTPGASNDATGADRGAISTIPTVVPSELLAQRPDIRAATATLQGSAAAVGVARAAMLPSLKLTAGLGRGGLLQPALLSGPAWIWAAAAQLTAPIFHGGALREQVKGAQATFEASKAQYRQTVLQAFQEVADRLAALDADRARIAALQTRWESTRRSTARQRERAALGAIPATAVRAAEQQDLAAARDLIDARATQWQDLIGLYQAIGATTPPHPAQNPDVAS